MSNLLTWPLSIDIEGARLLAGLPRSCTRLVPAAPMVLLLRVLLLRALLLQTLVSSVFPVEL